MPITYLKKVDPRLVVNADSATPPFRIEVWEFTYCPLTDANLGLKKVSKTPILALSYHDATIVADELNPLDEDGCPESTELYVKIIDSSNRIVVEYTPYDSNEEQNDHPF